VHAAFPADQKTPLKKQCHVFFHQIGLNLPTFVRQVWFAFINLAASRDAAGARFSAAVKIPN